MNKFNSIYESIMSENILFSHIPEIDNPLIVKEKKPNLNSVIEKLFPINIITEEPHIEVHYGNRILDFIKNNITELPTVIKFSRFINFISKRWKYYDNLKNNSYDKNIIIIGWHIDKLDVFLKIFSDTIGIKKQDYDIKEYEDYLKIITKKFKNAPGMFYETQNSYLLMFNFNSIDRNLISHELTHLFQTVLEINVFDDTFISYDNISYLSEEEKKYVFRDKEFWAIIFNDLFNGLQKIYWIKYNKRFKWEEFIHSFIENMNADTIFNENIYDDWVTIVNINDLCIRAIAGIKLMNNNLFLEVIDKLKNK